MGWKDVDREKQKCPILSGPKNYLITKFSCTGMKIYDEETESMTIKANYKICIQEVDVPSAAEEFRVTDPDDIDDYINEAELHIRQQLFDSVKRVLDKNWMLIHIPKPLNAAITTLHSRKIPHKFLRFGI
jgi:hypothetical protein